MRNRWKVTLAHQLEQGSLPNVGVLQILEKVKSLINQALVNEWSLTFSKRLALCSCKGKVTNMWRNKWRKTDQSVSKSMTRVNLIKKNKKTDNYIESETEHKLIERRKNCYVNVRWFRWRTWHWHDSYGSACWHDVYLWLHIGVLSLGRAAVTTVGWVGKGSRKTSLVRRIRTVHHRAAVLVLHLELANSHVRKHALKKQSDFFFKKKVGKREIAGMKATFRNTVVTESAKITFMFLAMLAMSADRSVQHADLH